MIRVARGLVTAFLLLCIPGRSIAQERTNLLSLAAGTIVLSHSGEYNGKWAAMNVVDGDRSTGWSTLEKAPYPMTMVLELSQTHQLTSLVLDSAQAQEAGYAGLSVRAVEVWLSNTGQDSGYVKAATLEAPKGARTEFPLPTHPSGRWLKLVITSNWGNKDFSELMEVEAYGAPVGPAPARPQLTGAYDTNYGRLDLLVNAGSVTGCYNNGTVQGTSDGRMINAEWRQGSANNTTSGGMLNGVWYRNGAIQGAWAGTRIPNAKAACATTANLSDSIANTGRAIVYGIRFNSDSAQLDPTSEATLTQVEALLRGKPALKITVEGHTDSTNTDAYNQDLSTRRANAVTAWLVAHGIDGARLKAVGYGKSRPIADNATPDGRAVNRRVEIASQ
jgi:outer membrane protein OmpA-like peptidoglycan-associated protein